MIFHPSKLKMTFSKKWLGRNWSFSSKVRSLSYWTNVPIWSDRPYLPRLESGRDPIWLNPVIIVKTDFKVVINVAMIILTFYSSDYDETNDLYCSSVTLKLNKIAHHGNFVNASAGYHSSYGRNKIFLDF